MKEHKVEVDYRCPIKVDSLSCYTTSAVNSVAVAAGMKWEDIVRILMGIAKERAYMPTYVTCVTDMLRMCGFATETCNMRVGEFLEACEASGSMDRYIIKLDYYGYYAAVPSETREGYALKGVREPDLYYVFYGFRSPVYYPENRKIDVLWKYHPGTDNRTGIKRDGFRMPYIAREHDDLAVVNMNPQDHAVGDCAVRALCAAMECTWGEAIDLLASASRYTDPVINSITNINNALMKLEFDRHKPQKRSNRLLTGKEFAELMTHTYFGGERIFAYVGRSHCAAFLPFAGPDGSVRYKAQDTWDSTDRKIGEYWIIPPKETRERRKARETRKAFGGASAGNAAFSVGDTVNHRQFGEGTIKAESETFVEAEFPGVGVKKISKAWLKKNCG